MISGPEALKELIKRLHEEIDESRWATDHEKRRLIWAGIHVARDEAVKYLNELEPPPEPCRWTHGPAD